MKIGVRFCRSRLYALVTIAAVGSTIALTATASATLLPGHLSRGGAINEHGGLSGHTPGKSGGLTATMLPVDTFTDPIGVVTPRRA
jgi:hypothetical protein